MKNIKILKKNKEKGGVFIPGLSAFLIALLTGLFFSGCNSEQNNSKELADPELTNLDRHIILSKDYVIDKTESHVKWFADKADMESFGTIDFARGQLGLGEGEILGGTFKLDLKSVSAGKPETTGKEKQLVDRLKSQDFFDVDAYPEGELEILSVSALSEDQSTVVDELEATHQVEATLTLRGVTRKVTFPARIEVVDGKIITETNQLIISPSEWGAETADVGEAEDIKSTMRLAITITANRV
ncbi:MAG: YceI family protein [Bacteroidota bacterium]